MRISCASAIICAAAIGLMAPAAAAIEAQSNTVSKDQKAQAQAEQQKKICKWLQVTGSNRPERHCLTKEDWKKAESLSW